MEEVELCLVKVRDRGGRGGERAEEVVGEEGEKEELGEERE